jgi:transaldolase
VFSRLEALGIDLIDVFQVLETEGVEKFEASWNELLDSVSQQLDRARAANGLSHTS